MNPISLNPKNESCVNKITESMENMKNLGINTIVYIEDIDCGDAGSRYTICSTDLEFRINRGIVHLISSDTYYEKNNNILLIGVDIYKFLDMLTDAIENYEKNQTFLIISSNLIESTNSIPSYDEIKQTLHNMSRIPHCIGENS